MGIEYYAFALFVFVLVCVIIFICKLLFSNIKQQKIILEEKETKLLRLYQTIEDAMDEFYDLVAESKTDIQAEYKKVSALAANITKAAETVEHIPEKPVAAIRRPPVKETPPSAPVPISEFKKALENASEAYANETVEEPAISASQASRNDKILELSDKGLSKTEIAMDLGITQNEVELVIEMNKK